MAKRKKDTPENEIKQPEIKGKNNLGQFAKGNEYWRKRSKHGRNRIIQDEQTLWDAADEYFNWCHTNPIYETDFRGKDLTEVKIPRPRPFKKEEFARFCGLSEWRLITDLKTVSPDFSQVITHIEKTIADQKYDYAVVGMFNSSIVAKDLGLADKKEVVKTTVKMTDEERAKRIKELKDKMK
jgi:hypothetical protein